MPVDTLQYVRRLEAAGVPRAEAEAHAEALSAVFSAELVTKADLVRIEERLAALRGELLGVIRSAGEGLRSQATTFATTTDVAAFRGELLAALERVHTDNARLETRLTRAVWTAASLGGLVGSLVVVVAKVLRWI